MIDYYTSEGKFLDIAKCWHHIYNTDLTKSDPDKWRNVCSSLFVELNGTEREFCYTMYFREKEKEKEITSYIYNMYIIGFETCRCVCDSFTL